MDGSRQSGEFRRVLFVTGRLAENALRKTLANLPANIVAEVAVLKITVAALMTTPWIARFLQVPPGTELVMIPGLCEGDPETLEKACGVPVRKGPKDLRELPRVFGYSMPSDYGQYSIEI